MYQKVIVSGDIIEVYTMDYAPFNPSLFNVNDDFDPFDYQVLKDKETSQMSLEELDRMEFWKNNKDKWDKHKKECRKQERRLQTTRDSRNLVRRLALSNFGKHSKFITLTFEDNLTDIDIANKIFKKFIRKLRKQKDDFKYISVIEFQSRGAVHYHMICNLDFTPWEELLERWRSCDKKCGSLDIRDIRSVDNVGAYIVKYMMKNSGDSRLQGKKMYLCSQGLERPKVYKGYEAELVIEAYLKNKKEIFTNSYESEHLGKIVYKEYNLKPNKKYRGKNKKEAS